MPLRVHNVRLLVENEVPDNCCPSCSIFKPDHLRPEIGKTCQMQLNAKKSKSGLSKRPRLDNARKLRGIYFIDPADEELKDIMKNARTKLEVPMPAAMHCKIRRGMYKKLVAILILACIVEDDNPTRNRMERTLHKGHEDKVAGRGMNSLSHYNLVHKFIPMPQTMKIPDAKVAVDKE